MESWIQEQEIQEWESARDQVSARLDLDAFQRQCDQLNKSHNDLVTRGRSIATEIEESDSGMFGGGAGGHTPHPAVARVEGVVERMEESKKRVEGVAGPRLLRLKESHQYHFIRQKSNKVWQV